MTATPLAIDVGARIRHLRRQAGLGVRELSREIGISPSSLSAIERGTAGMSLSRMQEVASYFGLHLSDLLADYQGRQDAARRDDVEIFRRACSSVASVERQRGVYYQNVGVSIGHLIQPYFIHFEPSAGYANDPVKHAGEEFNLVLYGELELLYGDETYQLGQGDLVRLNPEKEHAWQNPSRDGCALMIGGMTPPW
jgi:transcriptional regulator with XRE-family HTH domain